MNNKELNRIETAAAIFAMVGALTSCVFVYSFVFNELEKHIKYAVAMSVFMTVMYLYLIEYLGTVMMPAVFRALSFIKKPQLILNKNRGRRQWWLQVKGMRVLAASILLLLFVLTRATISVYTTFVGADQAASAVIETPDKPKISDFKNVNNTAKLQQQYDNNRQQIRELRDDKIMYRGKMTTKYVSAQAAAKLETENAKLSQMIAKAQREGQVNARKDYEQAIAEWKASSAELKGVADKYSDAFMYIGALSTVLSILLYLSLSILENESQYYARERGYSKLLSHLKNIDASKFKVKKQRQQKAASRQQVSEVRQHQRQQRPQSVDNMRSFTPPPIVEKEKERGGLFDLKEVEVEDVESLSKAEWESLRKSLHSYKNRLALYKRDGKQGLAENVKKTIKANLEKAEADGREDFVKKFKESLLEQNTPL